MQSLYARHQKLRCPKTFTSPSPNRDMLHHLLPRPVTSHPLWFLWTSTRLSAPEHRHAALCPPQFQQYVMLSVSTFLLACIKVMNVAEMLQFRPHPSFLRTSGSLRATFTISSGTFFSAVQSGVS